MYKLHRNIASQAMSQFEAYEQTQLVGFIIYWCNLVGLIVLRAHGVVSLLLCLCECRAPTLQHYSSLEVCPRSPV